MGDRREIGIAHDYEQLHALLRRRADELCVSRITLDEVSGLQDGYCAKLLAPVPIRGLGASTLGPLLGALGLALVVVEEQAALDRVRDRLTPRKYQLSLVPRRTAMGLAFVKKLASDGGKKRFAALSPAELSKHQSQAAKARWRAWRRARAEARRAAA